MTATSIKVRNINDEPDAADALKKQTLLTVAETCTLLRISRWSFYKLLQQRQLRTVTIGTRRLVPQAAIQEFLDHLDGENS